MCKMTNNMTKKKQHNTTKYLKHCQINIISIIHITNKHKVSPYITTMPNNIIKIHINKKHKVLL